VTTRSHLVTTRLSDYTHDPRVALVGSCVLSFRCQERSQAESTARQAYGCGAHGGTVQQSRQWLVFRPSKGNGSSRRRSSSTATGGNNATTAKSLSIPKRLLCEGFEAPKANADSAGVQGEDRGLRNELEPQSVSDLEPDVARKHCSGGHEGGGRSEKDWWEHILGVPTVGHIPSGRFQFERVSVPFRFSTSFIDHRGTRIDPDQTELRRDT
jgi:hypothetical protein